MRPASQPGQWDDSVKEGTGGTEGVHVGKSVSKAGADVFAAFLRAGREGCEFTGRSPACTATLRGGNAVAHPQESGVRNNGARDTGRADNVSYLRSNYPPASLMSVFGSRKAPPLQPWLATGRDQSQLLLAMGRGKGLRSAGVGNGDGTAFGGPRRQGQGNVGGEGAGLDHPRRGENGAGWHGKASRTGAPRTRGANKVVLPGARLMATTAAERHNLVAKERSRKAWSGGGGGTPGE